MFDLNDVYAFGFKETMKAFQTGAIIDALKRTNGSRTKAANLLKIQRTTLIMKMKALGVTTTVQVNQEKVAE